MLDGTYGGKIQVWIFKTEKQREVGENGLIRKDRSGNRKRFRYKF